MPSFQDVVWWVISVVVVGFLLNVAGSIAAPKIENWWGRTSAQRTVSRLVQLEEQFKQVQRYNQNKLDFALVVAYRLTFVIGYYFSSMALMVISSMLAQMIPFKDQVRPLFGVFEIPIASLSIGALVFGFLAFSLGHMRARSLTGLLYRVYYFDRYSEQIEEQRARLLRDRPAGEPTKE